MFIDGKNYRLTKHGRKRYRQRIGPAHDSEILENCVKGIAVSSAIWKRDKNGDYRLVTVLPDFNVESE